MAVCTRRSRGEPNRRSSTNTGGIRAALPAQDLARAKAFYTEKVGLQAVESHVLAANDGRVDLTVGDGVNQLFVYPAQARSSGEFTKAVIQVSAVRAAVGETRGRGVQFEEYDTPRRGLRTALLERRREARGGFKDSEGNLVGVVRSLPG